MKEPKILIVEDEKKIADSLKTGLSENGYNADVAYDGTIGFTLFKDHQYDLAILDINLPGKNGYELCKLFRSSNQQIPIIFLTSRIGLNDKIEGYDAGADDYILKPFELKELLFKIKVFLKRRQVKQSAGANILKAADLEMNLDTRQVKRNNKPLNLTAKEYQLLEYFLNNKNKIISRQEIARQVWDIDFDTNTNIIEVYINYLRNKIDKDFGHKLIYTQVGMGYVLKDTGS